MSISLEDRELRLGVVRYEGSIPFTRFRPAPAGLQRGTARYLHLLRRSIEPQRTKADSMVMHYDYILARSYLVSYRATQTIVEPQGSAFWRHPDGPLTTTCATFLY
jgi:hypothetical protein